MRHRTKLPLVLAGALVVGSALAVAGLASATPATLHVVPSVNQLATVPSGGSLQGIDCVTTASCVTVGRDLNGEPLTFTGAPAAWGPATARQASLSPVFGSTGMTAVSCTASTLCTAVGADGKFLPLTLHGNPASWGTAQARQIPIGATFGGYESLTALSCTAATYCVAVGTNGRSQPIVLAGNPANWGLAQLSAIALGSGFGNGGALDAVDCLSSTQCVAVGNDYNGQPFALVGDPSTWSAAQATEITLGSGFDDRGYLYAISCTSTSQCTATGSDGFGQPLTISGDPASWTATQATEITLSSAYGSGGEFQSVSCSSATTCAAVGFDYKDQPVVLSGDPASWSVSQLIQDNLSAAFGKGGLLYSISCKTAAQCTAVGSDSEGNPIILNGDPSTFTAAHVRQILLHGATFGALAGFHALDCTARTECVALGQTLGFKDLVLRGNPAAWGAAQTRVLALPAALGTVTLDSLSCVSAAFCVAVGTDSKSQPVLLHGNPASWGAPQLRQLTLPSSDGDGGYLTTVSCVTATFCTAVGTDYRGQPVVVRGNPAAWTGSMVHQLMLATSLGGGGSFRAVGCVSVAYCVAVGNDYKNMPVEISGNPATWGPADVHQITLGAAFGKGGSLSSVQCESAADCVAVGVDTDEVPLVFSGKASTWTPSRAEHVRIAETPGTVEGFSTLERSTDGTLDDVSCASVTDCIAVGADDDSSPIFLDGSPATWNRGTAGRPADIPNFTNGSFDAVACVAGQCFVVGADRSTAEAGRTAFIAPL